MPATTRMTILDQEIRRGLAYIAPYKTRLAVILLLNLASTALALYVPFLTRTLVDDALLGQDTDALTRVVVLFTLVTAAASS